MSDVLLGALILLGVSLTVKVLPAYLPVPQRWLEPMQRVLPVVVLLNLAVYSIADEVRAEPLPGAAGAVVLAALVLGTRLPLVLSVVLACGAYALAVALV